MQRTWTLFGKSAPWTVPTSIVRPPRASAVAVEAEATVGPEPARCRRCAGELETTILDLGNQPAVDRNAPGISMPNEPLRVAHCARCDLVQLAKERPGELAVGNPVRTPADAEALIKGLRLTSGSLVVEVGSGNGAGLVPFRNQGIRVLGMEPNHHAVSSAAEAGVPTRACQFDVFSARKLAKEGLCADLLLASDFIARTARLDAFVEAARRALKVNGILLLEVPHLLKIVQETRFDIIRHEYLSYFSLMSLDRLLGSHGLRVVHASPIRGSGLLRVYACRIESALVESETVGKMLAREKSARLDQAETVRQFGERARTVIERIQNFVRDLRKDGKSIVAYGSSADSDALLGYCSARASDIAYIADPDRSKHGTILPVTSIPVAAPELIRTSRPDFVLVLPGCPIEDVVRKHRYIQSWGGRFGCLALR